MNTMEPMLTPQEVSKLLKISLSSIYFYGTVGKLKSVRIGRHMRFPAEAIETLLNGTRKGGRP